MKNIVLAVAFIFGSLVVGAEPLKAQQDYIIAGDNLVMLWEALDSGTLTIKHSELRKHILDRSLSAIFLPKGQAGNMRKVRLCFEEKSVFDEPDAEIPGSDFEQLVKYSRDLVYEYTTKIRRALHSGNRADIQTKSQLLKKELDGLPVDQKLALRRFVGAVLAEVVDPVPADLAAYVQEYKASKEEQVLRMLPEDRKFMEAGSRLYFAGKEPFTAADIGRIDPSKVINFEKSGVPYRKVWVGSTFLVAPQAPKGSAAYALRDPTGLGLDPAIWSSSSAKELIIDVNGYFQ